MRSLFWFVLAGVGSVTVLFSLNFPAPHLYFFLLLCSVRILTFFSYCTVFKDFVYTCLFLLICVIGT